MRGGAPHSDAGRIKDPAAQAQFSYRGDTSVPGFDDGGPVVFMDGTCVLCSRTARIIARLDKRQEFRICPVQTPLGHAILGHYGLDAADPDSWLYLEDGRAYTSMDAVIRAGMRLGGWGRLVAVLRLLPRPVRHWLYRRIARNRYRLFGHTDICALHDPALRRRLIG
jgi:predicted DCC family thiol-disulfide oxidoreductase YuxK